MNKRRAEPRQPVLRKSGVKLWRPGAEDGDNATPANPEEDGQEDDLDALLDMYSAEAEKATKDVLQRNKKPATAKNMAELRDEGLNQPLSAENKGFQLLKAMGYKEGEGLGRSAKGSTQPVELSLKAGRAGLGVDEERRRKKRDAEQNAQQKAAQRAALQQRVSASYVSGRASAFAARRVGGQLAAALRSAKQLDAAAGVAHNPLVEDEEALAEEAKEAATSAPPQEKLATPSEEQLRQRLQRLLDYLRDVHCYCLFCGCKYEDWDDLRSSCPGPSEEDH